MSAPILDIRVRDMLHVALDQGASDIHVVPNRTPAIRVDGLLAPLSGSPLTPADSGVIARALFGDALVARIETGEDVTTTIVHEMGLTLRVHGYRSLSGIALAMRLLGAAVPRLETLGLPAAIANLADARSGLVVFAGPTGCGKTTSLAALVDRINATQARRVLTIEDPVEYRHEPKESSIVQREIGRDAPSFESAVLGALRADPDVLLVGEMRDRATMRAVLTAAETGHLVLTTLHTGDAAGTIDRIVDAFGDTERTHVRAQLASVLSAVVCQQLVRRVGVRGRRAAAEILIANDAIRAIVREGRSHQLRNCVVTGRSSGMQTLESHLADLVASHEIDRTSALAAANRPDELERAIGAVA